MYIHYWIFYSIGYNCVDVEFFTRSSFWHMTKLLHKHLPRIIIFSVLIAGTIFYFSAKEISAPTNAQPEELQAACSSDSDCPLPMDYAIQSNCPFGTVCIEGSCSVGCSFTSHDPDPSISTSYPIACQTNSDCDCSDRGEKTLQCVCHNNGCLSIEATF